MGGAEGHPGKRIRTRRASYSRPGLGRESCLPWANHLECIRLIHLRASSWASSVRLDWSGGSALKVGEPDMWFDFEVSQLCALSADFTLGFHLTAGHWGARPELAPKCFGAILSGLSEGFAAWGGKLQTDDSVGKAQSRSGRALPMPRQLQLSFWRWCQLCLFMLTGRLARGSKSVPMCPSHQG